MRGSEAEAVTEEVTLLRVSPVLKEGQQTCPSAPSSTSLYKLVVWFAGHSVLETPPPQMQGSALAVSTVPGGPAVLSATPFA